MKFYKIDMQGKQWLQRVSSLSAWAAADEGRLVYDEASNVPFIADNADWREVWTAGNMGNGSGLDADLLRNYQPGNSSGMIALNNGTVNTNLDADELDGQHGSYYRNAGNLNAGIVPSARLSGTYNISISGTSGAAKYS
jgi:hypothetical protein